MSVNSVFFLAVGIGIVAGLRAMTAPTTLRTETADGVRSIVFCRPAG